MTDLGKFTEKITDELLFSRKFTIKTDLSPEDSAEQIEDLAMVTRTKRSGYTTIINSIGRNRYRVLMYTRRFPANSRTAELKGRLVVGQDGVTRLTGKVRFGSSYYLLAMTGLVFASFVAFMSYSFNMEILLLDASVPYFSIVSDMLLIGLFLGAIPLLMLVRVFTDRNRLLKTLVRTLNS